MTNLFLLAAPPKTPLGPGSPAEWAAFERFWKIRVPDDYKSVISAYGSGKFADFFGVATPFHVAKNDITFEQFVNLRLEGVRYAQAAMPKHAAIFTTYPAHKGLFPFGYTDNGGTLFWLTEGEPSQWPIVCMDNGYTRDFDLYHLPLASFLEQYLSNKIRVVTTPASLFPLKSPVFVPLP
jgi:hypothetical protein